MQATLSHKGQIVIPAVIRSALGLQAGDRFEVQLDGDTVSFSRLPRNLSGLRGILKGTDGMEELLRERQIEREQDLDLQPEVTSRCFSRRTAAA